ncbi:MAG: helix-turn-helix domain-containing protein [Deltaproteobacteria bacterium]|nr:helix-turn-helix domain-containing protein [Deltaproteobacteria bacterium]
MEQCTITDNNYWDIKDLSGYLKVKIKTLYAMLPDIPHYRLRKQIRFKKQEIDSWMEHNRIMAPSQSNKTQNSGGKRSGKGNADIDRMIRKAIDQSKHPSYNPEHGKSDRIEGPKKEINHGSV